MTKVSDGSTKPGIYLHHKEGKYRVLFTVRDSTNGDDEGRWLVVYVSMTTGMILARDEQQFHESVDKKSRFMTDGGVIRVPRFAFLSENGK